MDEPRFSEPIPNVTVALGRDASLPCVVENLGKFKVSRAGYDFFPALEITEIIELLMLLREFRPGRSGPALCHLRGVISLYYSQLSTVSFLAFYSPVFCSPFINIPLRAFPRLQFLSRARQNYHVFNYTWIWYRCKYPRFLQGPNL